MIKALLDLVKDLDSAALNLGQRLLCFVKRTMAFEEEETGAAAWDTDARGAAFLKRFLTRMARQAALANQRELYGAWRVWLTKLREERRTRGARARRARHDAMLATLREHAPGERDPAVVAGLVAWASGAFAGADASALPRLCQHLAVTERAAGDLLWLQGDVADKYYVLHAGLIKLFRHSTPIMTRECRDLYGDRRAVLRRRPPELTRAARGCRVLELLTDTLRSAVTSKKCFGTLAESHVEAPILTWGPLQFFSTSLAMRRAPPRRTNLLGERLKWRYMRKFTLCKFKCSEVS